MTYEHLNKTNLKKKELRIWNTPEDQYLLGFSKALNCKTPPVHIICLYTTLITTENLLITRKGNFFIIIQAKKSMVSTSSRLKPF